MDNKIALWEKVFSKRGYKFLLFLISYILAVVVTLGVLAIINRGLLLDIEEAIIALTFFPVGLSYYFSGGIDYSFFLSAYHNLGDYLYFSLYPIITLLVVIVENSRTAKILYFIFVSLLILNICAWVADLV